MISSTNNALANVPHLALYSTTTRGLSVLSWGRNTENQCGIEGGQALITQPTAILELLQHPVSCVSAGKTNSAAVVRGDVHVWGDGASGKLGLSCGEGASSPSRVEAFVGQSSIKSVALGQHHSLFLDAGGNLWAAGENKEGQCGLGTPKAELLRQHISALQRALARGSSDTGIEQHQLLHAAAAAAEARAPRSWATIWHNSGDGRATGAWSSDSGTAARSSISSFVAQMMDRQAGHRSKRLGSSTSALWAAGSHDPAAFLTGLDMQLHMQALQMEPGQNHTPVRVGCQHTTHSLFMQSHQQPRQQMPGQEFWSDDDSHDSADSLSQEQVVDMAAGKYMSVAATAKGEVWTFGACYNGALSSPDGSSLQTTPMRVAGPLSSVIAGQGGAVAVAAGSTFAAALTATGRVLIWGKLVINSSKHPSSHSRRFVDAGADVRSASNDSSSPGWVEVGLPCGVKVQHIAAGQQHLLMSDGDRVWAVGRWMDADGQEAGCAAAQCPAELLSSPRAGIIKLAAGMHSSAAIDGMGQLWMWGRLVDHHTAQALVLQRHSLQRGILSIPKDLPGGSAAGVADLHRAADEAQRLQQVEWDWSGFGGASPAVVDGLSGVSDVALGGWHALVLVN